MMELEIEMVKGQHQLFAFYKLYMKLSLSVCHAKWFATFFSEQLQLKSDELGSCKSVLVCLYRD